MGSLHQSMSLPHFQELVFTSCHSLSSSTLLYDDLKTSEGFVLPQAIPDRGGCFECFEVGRESEASSVVLPRAIPHTCVGGCWPVKGWKVTPRQNDRAISLGS